MDSGGVRRCVTLLVALAAQFAIAEPSELPQAEKFYERTEYSPAIHLLAGLKDKTSAVNVLLGKCYFMTGDYKKSAEYLEKAVGAEPKNSIYQGWLGRLYLRRAESSFPLTAMRWASKGRTALETAAQLDPSNYEAVGDLFDFYMDAPGVMGGGIEKAEKLAVTVAQRDPAEGEYDQFRIAEQRKQFDAAEKHLRRAAELEPLQVGRQLDLAKFLAGRGRHEESDRIFAHARDFAAKEPKVFFAEASTYIKSNRKIDSAKILLKQYLAASNVTPDDPPKEDARKLLNKVSGS
jgi:Flp pilus assembly protein TadD